MSNLQQYGARGPLSDPPQLGEYVVVLASDAEAAITKIAAVSVEQILGSDEDTRAAIEQAYAAGQEEMLAKCIAAVEGLERLSAHADQDDPVAGYIVKDNGIVVYRSQALAALRALQEKP